jgi:hypothetical protein
MNKKKPDNVVDSPGTMPYPTNLAAPAFTVPDVLTYKSEHTKTASAYLDSCFEELKQQYIELAKLAYDTQLVYNAKISFIPIVGHIYHLYTNDNNVLFLSMIEPENWQKMKHMGTFKYSTNTTWIRIDTSGNI